jgi:hypothetical protein
MQDHGTDTRYRANGCRCARCRAAHAEANREGNRRQQARWLADGRTQRDGSPRTTPYTKAQLAMMERFGLEPDPRFVWSPPA